ncbi:hypothetical protein SOPEG_2296 [Candidatus Sodalis pierantonius str. SOPE]|uniref:Gp5/Type VI secretion system Vgr protein OB-fold domain-containing protein n=1 Tax=Candidatus Sodalis pierantonii str. SOPE TaxID=2342 RepID=W0HNM1_9GAMM|nr:hypothetical protein [Candidatus Sodalis pierantonius]AHF74102.1 hypothetical protein SOPEG_2296 [Candidatus Sodalis pierantonius str. SOPE]
MKPIKRLMLSGDTVPLVDVNLILEISASGHGFITAQTEKDYSGKLVRLDIGYPERVLRWFTGFVERAQPAGKGFQRLFVREMSGIFDHPWPCSFQHPTLRQIAEWIQAQSGLSVVLPTASNDTDTPIPHFTHSGSGYQLLATLGPAFGIQDYLWQPLPDGGIYLGGAAHSLFAGKPVSIPPEFSQTQAAGNTLTLPMVPSLRPGVVVNGKPLITVRLENDTMALTWQAANPLTGKTTAKSPAQRQIDAAYPELSAGLHLPKFARVEGPSEAVSRGDLADPFRPRYAVDVQLLDADGNPAANTPVYPAVPLPLPMAGAESGLFHFPPPGTLLEIGFTEGRPDKPFVRQILAHGQTLPDIKPGEQLQQQRAEVFQRVPVAGDWERQTDQSIRENAQHREITADSENRTLVTRTTTVQATDKTTVLGGARLLAGSIQQIAEGDYSVATRAHYVASIGQNATTDIGGDLIEKIGNIRRSLATARQGRVIATK